MSHGSQIRREWPREGLRVIHVLMSLDPGGAERLLADALPRFPRDRYRMEALALGHDGPMGDMLRGAGVKVTVLNGSRKIPAFLSGLIRTLRQNTPHVLHTHLYWPGLLGRAVGRLMGIDVIVSHEHVVAEWLSKTRRAIERPTWRLADAVIGVSDAVLESRKSDLPEGLLKTKIYNGIVIDDVPVKKDFLRSAFKPSEIVAGWVGRVDDAQKNVSAIIESARLLRTKCPELRWVLIGDGPDAARLKAKSRDLESEGALKWMGALPDARNYYRDFDIFVLPSRYEGLGIVLIEAMAAGLPVVAAAVGPVPEVVKDDTGILTPPGDVAAFAEAILKLARDPELRVSMGAAGRRRAEQIFSIESFVKNMDDFYRRIWTGEAN